MKSNVAGSAAARVLTGPDRPPAAGNYPPPKRQGTKPSPKTGAFNRVEVLPGVRPELLAETQAIAFSAGIVLSALAAKISTSM